MAVATGWIDDVVTGQVPAVCVKSGRPVDVWVRDEAEVRSPSLWLFLLVFVGPVGWIALVALLLVGVGRQRITVELPFATDELDRLKRARANRRHAGVGVAAATVVAILGPWSGVVFGWVPGMSILMAVAVVSVVLLAVTHLRLWSLEVGVSLDASGRWVTLRDVSPEFAALARAQMQRRSDDHGRPRP